MGARIVMSTFGSLGDLYPYLAVARELKRRGHGITIASFEAYRDRVIAEGIGFHPVRPDIDPNDKEELRRVMDKRNGPTYLLRDIVFRFLRETFADCREAAKGADLIVTHPVAYGMLLAARAAGRPWASVALSPVSLFSALDASVYSGLPFADAIAGLGPSIQRALTRLVDFGTRRWQKSYIDLETELGLPHGPNPVIAGQHSPYRVLALFSAELAAPQADWPLNTRATGFPFYEQKDSLSPELARFLDAGEPPIVFTLGSAAVGTAGDFFQQSADATQRLGQRAVLLVGRDPENLPTTLPQGVIAVPYAPHAAVFSRARVVVHQGGIGTTAEVMRAGCPSLVVPYSHDQPDHARRLRRRGLAGNLARESYTAKSAARAIQTLIDDPGYATRAAEIGRRVRVEDGVRHAADSLEELL